MEKQGAVRPWGTCDGIHETDNELCFPCIMVLNKKLKGLMKFTSIIQRLETIVPVAFCFHVEKEAMQRILNHGPEKNS